MIIIFLTYVKVIYALNEQLSNLAFLALKISDLPSI